MMQGKFISIEGSEGAGKSTALQFISDYLLHKKIEIVLTREPGGTPVAEEIRKILLHTAGDEILQPETELLLMFACRSQNISHCILPALQAGKWVISDRFIDASYAYQAGGRDMNIHDVEALDHIIVDDLYPDLTLLLDISVDQGMARTELRGTEKDRIEQEKLDFFERVRAAYLERARQDPNRIKIIDASQSLPMVQNQMRNVLDDFFARQIQ